MLAWRPGELTRRYVHGERARFVSPIALFLFSVFLMFAVFSLVGGPIDFTQPEQTAAELRAEAQRDFRREQAKHERDLARLRTERETLAAPGSRRERSTREISGVERRCAAEQQVFRRAMALITAQESGEADRTAEGTAGSAPTTGVDITQRRPARWTGPGANARENPALLAYKLQTNAYKFSWALIPISVPFVWLLFLHRRRYRQFKAYDHTVFVTYSIAFMSLGLIAAQPAAGARRRRGADRARHHPGAADPHLPAAARRLSAVALERDLADLPPVMFAFTAGGLFFMLLVALGALG